MRRLEGNLLLSPGDLVTFLGCRHASALAHRALDEELATVGADATMKFVQEKGIAHERAFLERLEAEGRRVVRIPEKASLQARVLMTVEAMHTGADVVYQAALLDGMWHGLADFLMKTAEPSDLGNWSYETLDTKLSSGIKPQYAVQLNIYSDLVGKLQGRQPRRMSIALGDGRTEVLNTGDFVHYVRLAAQRLEGFLADAAVRTATVPDPCGACDMCPWRDRCKAEWLAADHLCLVANIRRSQRDRLAAAGISTMTALAEMPDGRKVTGMVAETLGKLRAQARLQVAVCDTDEHRHELLPALPGRGFARLPPPAEGDLFFDMEGDPLYRDPVHGDGGLEYLFGVHLGDPAAGIFHAFWAHDRDNERLALEAFLDFVTAHLAVHPDAHIYHYNHYEVTAVRRLAMRHGTREAVVDDLLRRQKFVDLFKVVRESLLVSEPRYSLKNIEHFYMGKREGEVSTAGDSIVAYETWRVTREQRILDEIEHYNAIDCRSTAGLRDWLLTVRPADAPWFDPAPVAPDEEALARQAEAEAERAAIEAALLYGVSEAEKPFRRLVADLVEFHRREAKPEWWALFDRQGHGEDEFPTTAAARQLFGKPADNNPLELEESLTTITHSYTRLIDVRARPRRSGRDETNSRLPSNCIPVVPIGILFSSLQDDRVKTEILTRLINARNGLDTRALAKKLGLDNVVLVSRELQSLQSDDFVRFSSGRWLVTLKGLQVVESAKSRPSTVRPSSPRPSPRASRDPVSAEKGEPAAGDGEDALEAVPVRARRQQQAVTSPVEAAQGKALSIPALLSYYRQCLAVEDRSDPVANWDEAGTRFTPIRLSGPWWPSDDHPSQLTVARIMLQHGFQQAMGRMPGEKTVHLGYPLDVFRSGSSGFMVRAVCSVPLRWKTTKDDVIVFETTETAVCLNPGWMGFNRKAVNFKALAGRINPQLLDTRSDDEDDDEPVFQSVEFNDICVALNFAFAKKRNQELEPEETEARLYARPGLHNVAALFITGGAKYSAAAIRDLEALSKLRGAQFEGTALGTLLGLPPPPRRDAAVLEPLDLTYSQLTAVRSALSEPLTVITGPPGTGKSQVVTAILAAAAAHGRTALFASRNHAALDAVEPRMEELSPDRRLMVRFSQRWGGKMPPRISDLIQAIVARPVPAGTGIGPEHLVSSLSGLDRDRADAMNRAGRIAIDRDAVGACEEELAQHLTALSLTAAQVMELPSQPHARAAQSWWGSWVMALFPSMPSPLRLFLAKQLHSRSWEDAGCPAPTKANMERHAQWTERMHRAKALIVEIHELASRLPSDQDQAALGKRLEELTTEVRAGAQRLMPTIAKWCDWIDEDARQRLMEIRGNVGRDRLSADDVKMVLRHYPIWALSNLTVAKFVPPAPLFDYVVIDEASQCDIASALPLLARARQVIVVGDPAQLGVVSKLSPDWEVEVLESLGLASAPGIGRYRQSRNSLFDVASTVKGASRHLLTDHFRCHADIAAYVEGFYGSQLSVLTQTTELRPPAGQRPGLFWERVGGRIVEASKGCHAPDEAVAIISALRQLLLEQNYEGTVGVCTPFREQANRISDKIADTFPPGLVEQRRLIAQTANGFQGDARDVIFISPCLGPGTPAGSLAFVRDGGNLFNVAVSRARAVCRIFGNADFARGCGIPHITRLVDACDRQNRNSGERPIFDSPWEEKLFVALEEAGIKCATQYPIAGRRLDLAWFTQGGKRIDIEVDGDRYHRDPNGLRKIDDLWRDHQLRSLGWEVIRFWVYELREDMNGCVERIRRAVAG